MPHPQNLFLSTQFVISPKNEKFISFENTVYIVRQDPMQMKSFHKWLATKIEEYESVFGHIPSPE